MVKPIWIGMRIAGAATLVAAATISLAAPSGSGSNQDIPSPSSQPGQPATQSDYEKAVYLIKAKQYGLAIPFLDRVVAGEPKNADALNWLGFCHRKLGQTEPSLTFYQRALEADPAHKGAHEYLGELYLIMNDLPKAQDMLTKLKALCPKGCEELEDLEEAVAAYKPK